MLAGLLAAAIPGRAADVAPIVPPAKRVEVLERARNLLAPRSVPGSVANPFYSESYYEVLTGVPAGREGEQTAVEHPGATRPEPAGPRGERDLLRAIAASLKPSGYIVMGGVPSLSFGQKRVKPGGLLTITFEGKEYTLEITAIERTQFTLRLNREEFTRPIK
ncbi:MAG: hypothetical protein ACOZE5_02580 [Verrucomicrobiota bacterium]